MKYKESGPQKICLDILFFSMILLGWFGFIGIEEVQRDGNPDKFFSD